VSLLESTSATPKLLPSHKICHPEHSSQPLKSLSCRTDPLRAARAFHAFTGFTSPLPLLRMKFKADHRETTLSSKKTRERL
jgi:hypothetical protein